MRRAVLSLLYMLVLSVLPLAAQAERRGCTAGDGLYLTRVCYTQSARQKEYGHHVLGNTPEWTGLYIEATVIGQSALNLPARITRTGLPDTTIYEDLAPRVVDMSGDGLPEIVTIVSIVDQGASLFVWNLAENLTASTRPVGRSHRWLAPVGIADFNKDGRMDVAFVDRPHLAKTLKIFSYTEALRGPVLSALDEIEGLTNHRIGQNFIQGGVANCGRGPIMYTASADWSQIVAIGWDGSQFITVPRGPYKGPDSFADYLACR